MSIRNTGRKIFQFLQQYSVLTGVSTGNVKPNLPSDPDYIAPITDLVACPVPNIDVSNITQIRARVINNTSQFINCSNIYIATQSNPIPVLSQPFSKGPGQSLLSNFQIQASSIAGVSITTTTSSLSIPCKFKVIWKRNNLTYLLYTSSSFIFDGDTLEVNPLILPFNVLNEENEVQIIFEDDNSTTTTTTTSTTTSTTSTTTTTTVDPNSTVLVFVDPLTDSDTVINSISFLDSLDTVIATITDDVDNTLGVVPFSIPTGIYKILVEVVGTGGNSVIIQLPTPISQKYIGPGTYCFENINIAGGISIVINQSVSAIATVFARIEYGATTTESIPVLPFGLIEREKALVAIFFYSDLACTVPETLSSTKVNFSIKLTNNITSAEVTSNTYETLELGESSVLIAEILEEKQWDYTLNDPDSPEDPDDLVADTSYEYEILPTFGLIKV